MRFFNLLVHAVLLFTTPTLLLYPHTEFQFEETCHENTPFFSYDEVLNLIDDLESGKLEKNCSFEELEKTTHLLANLARKGIISNELEESLILEEDIQELLDEEYYSSTPMFVYGGKVLLCGHRHWFEKQLKQAKKFLKKHKKAILIGAAVVVATAVAVCAVVAASTAAAVGAAAAACDDEEDTSAKTKDEVVPLGVITTNETPILFVTIEEHVSTLKELAIEDQFLENGNDDDLSLSEKARQLGAALAHDVLDEIADLACMIPQLTEELNNVGNRIIPQWFRSPNHSQLNATESFERTIATGHERIDQVFSTHHERGRHRGRIINNNLVIGTIPLPLPGSFCKGINTEKFREAIQASQKTAVLAEELTIHDVAHLKKTGTLEARINTVIKDIFGERTIQRPSPQISFSEHALKRALERDISHEAISDALSSPLKIGEIKIDHLGRPSQRFIGKEAEVVLNPATNQIVSVNPTSTKKAEKLIHSSTHGKN